MRKDAPRADPEARVAGERGERARAPFEGLDQPHERLLRVPCPTRSRGDVRTSPSDATVRAPRAGAPTAAWGIAREPSADLGDEGPRNRDGSRATALPFSRCPEPALHSGRFCLQLLRRLLVKWL